MINFVLPKKYDASRNYLLVGAAIAMIFAVLEFLGLFTPVRARLEKILSPARFLGAEIVAWVDSPYFVLQNSFQGYQHVQDLEIHYAQAVAQLDELENLRSENQELKQLLEKTATASSERTTTTQIVSPILAYGQPYIGKGSMDGVTEGDMVFISDTLVGRVGGVSSYQAEIILLQAANSTPVLAKTESGVTGIVQGDGKQVLLKELPADADVKIGERVLTAGQEGVPQSISLGIVRSVEKRPNAATQTAVIDQIVSFYQSQLVIISK